MIGTLRNTRRGVRYGSQGPRRGVIGRCLAELSSPLAYIGRLLGGATGRADIGPVEGARRLPVDGVAPEFSRAAGIEADIVRVAGGRLVRGDLK